VPFRIFCFFAFCLSLAAGELHAAPEYGIKTAIMYNLMRLVEWPTQTQNSVQVCFIGAEPFADALNLIRDKQVRNRPLEFVKDIRLEQAENCAVLFIAASESERLEEILTAVNHLPLLTVADSEGFAERGVITNLIREDNKIRVHLNLKAAERAHLGISQTLLELAQEVEDKFTPVP
jgi:hypothetical protein